MPKTETAHGQIISKHQLSPPPSSSSTKHASSPPPPTRNRGRLRRLPDLVPEIQLPASHHGSHGRLLRDDNLRHDGAAHAIAVPLQRVLLVGFEQRDGDVRQVAAGALDEVPGEEEGGGVCGSWGFSEGMRGWWRRRLGGGGG